MKRIWITGVAALLAVLMLAGCGAASSPQKQADDKPESTEKAPYEFELTDIDGNVHRLSDYSGKPVYLKVWGTWCSVCVASLPKLEELSSETKDFVVLSVVPNVPGELNREDLADWLNEHGYEKTVVLYDDNAQIVGDFNVSAFPTQIMFDADGVPVYGVMGELGNKEIAETMNKIAGKETS